MGQVMGKPANWWIMWRYNLTWRGRLAALWYAVRRLVVDPAPDEVRCWDGSKIPHDLAWCPRRAITEDGFWCQWHRPMMTKEIP